ncbi:hypothetical protein DCAR_0519749 [Daucus carota subsp. sativus]|uniref:Protein FAR1-RELATED SEQUENCE n=1 Tax=Daucus carota subsp. sativus TaxID=79200 RepID=A0AAF0X2U3_DAUCS|nr:hypothetical protein DCAR_0519749 [Daucus carota subsp. sativus]
MRESWIPAYFRDKPMYGLIRTTSRSESENFFFSQFHQSGSTLSEFYIRFESAMDKQRNETKNLNHVDSSAKPATISTLFLEDDAAELYTREIFYKIQEEILAAPGIDLVKLKQISTTVKELHVSFVNDGASFNKKDFLGNLIGNKPVGEITIHPPVQCKNKGSGLKRLLSEREKAIKQVEKKKRKCKLCGSTVHDQRTCPKKKKIVEEEVMNGVDTEL